MRPSQNPGTACPSTAPVMPNRSKSEPRRTADKTPTGTATQKVNSSTGSPPSRTRKKTAVSERKTTRRVCPSRDRRYARIPGSVPDPPAGPERTNAIVGGVFFHVARAGSLGFGGRRRLRDRAGGLRQRGGHRLPGGGGGRRHGGPGRLVDARP